MNSNFFFFLDAVNPLNKEINIKKLAPEPTSALFFQRVDAQTCV